MMMTLGWFVFQLHTAPFQEKQRTTSQRWAANNRVGRRPAYQYVGPGEDAITLSGVLLPEISGGLQNLDHLRSMAATGKAWSLIDGNGYTQGLWFIDSVEEAQSIFFRDGTARRIDFSISLKRCDSKSSSILGGLTLSLLGAI